MHILRAGLHRVQEHNGLSEICQENEKFYQELDTIASCLVSVIQGDKLDG